MAAQIGAYASWLRLINLCTRRPVTGTCNADVSLTSYGHRLKSVWATIESIGRGSERPKRIILWLDDEAMVSRPPKELLRLSKRGLEIKLCRDYGPHKKYYPYVTQCALTRTLVTADDDVYYPKFWLKDLVAAHKGSQVTAYRAHLRSSAPYRDWPICRTTDPAESVFATGVSGVAYPIPLLRKLRSRGDEFLTICPRADDFWLHFAAVASGIPIRQMASYPADWWPQLHLAGKGLWRENLDSGGNDAIIEATQAAWLSDHRSGCAGNLEAQDIDLGGCHLTDDAGS